ncbi:Thiamine biosynthesis lipoprotein ApbE precursor [Sodalis glossinidius str. 'morsitans']|uniref:FAD:protein FMN transferase n=1 Tax=Sodalis glossinidius (strain morsitans) TaxID=343509 RepID=Q2NTU6_SODGM|nr:FAD:protein FMN transferase ApbE [Sodalis glossinidius]BAE74429.1 thiamin biosynthesis lipoprotein [Sodalis glossinidius str. 'morsitans']CRL45071.1 Thiamine biosynthesis lipoprotein ApbE precursor [Sodalis glossinidius str. 'morsitans']
MTRLTGVIMATLMLLGGCDGATPPEQAQSWRAEGKTMGTYYRVLVANPPAAALTGLNEAIEQRLAEDNHQISTWQDDTILSRFNRYHGTEPQPITPGMADIISTALRVGAKTGGEMDITIGPLVNLWGFGPEKQPTKTPDAKQIESARARVGLAHLRLIETSEGQWLQKSMPDMYVDLSTVGEGYATDHLAALLEQRGITRYLVSVGGAVLTRGLSSCQQPWRVAIQHPTDEFVAAEAVVDLQGHGISTSGSYRNYYELEGKRVSHVIDPVTGGPIDHKLVSATVIATTALEADGWDTGLMVLGTEKAKQLALQEGLAVFLITKTDHGFTTWMSPQFSSFIISHSDKDA